MEVFGTPFTPIRVPEIVQSMLVVPEEALLITASHCDAYFWRLPELRHGASQTKKLEAIQALGYHRATRQVLFGSFETGLAIINLKDRSLQTVRLPVTEKEGTITFSPDGSKVALFTNRRAGQLWEWGEAKPLTNLKNCLYTRNFTFSHDGAYVAAYQGQDVQIWKTDTGDEQESIPEKAVFMSFLPDQSLVIGTENYEVALFEYRNYGRQRWNHAWTVTVDELRDVASPPGSNVITCLTAESVCLLDNHGRDRGEMTLLTEEQLRQKKNKNPIHKPDDHLYTLAVAPKFGLVVAGNGYNLIYAWPC